MKTDFYYKNEGSVIALLPQTAEAYKWSEKNINKGSCQNPDCILIELRYFQDIGEGIKNDGLTIEKSPE
jgi:hypothetical protein